MGPAKASACLHACMLARAFICPRVAARQNGRSPPLFRSSSKESLPVPSSIVLWREISMQADSRESKAAERKRRWRSHWLAAKTLTQQRARAPQLYPTAPSAPCCHRGRSTKHQRPACELIRCRWSATDVGHTHRAVAAARPAPARHAGEITLRSLRTSSSGTACASSGFRPAPRP